MDLRASIVEVVVSDMAASVAFYRRLGVAFPEGVEGEGHVHTDLGGGLLLALDTEEVIRSFDPEWSPPEGGHRVALAFACASPAAVDAAWMELTNAGYQGHLAPWDAFWGMRYAVVHDPDGTTVDLFAPLAPS